VLFERSNRSTEPWISVEDVEPVLDAVAPEVSDEVLPDIVPVLEELDPDIVSEPVLVVPLLVPVSVEDGVLPIEPLFVSSVVEVDDDPVVLPLLWVLVLPEVP
jgi:hypothetical protein